MNGRTTKLLLARKKKGVVYKRRPQLGGVKNWSKLTTNSTKKPGDMGEGGVKNSEKLPTSFMDGPKEEGRQNNGKLSRLSTTAH